MKIRSKPQDYEAIVFHDDIETCHAVQEFIGGDARLICEPERKVLSTLVGNTVLEDGNVIYKHNNAIHVAKEFQGSP